MRITRRGTRDFYLFLDIFVHWSGRKVTAVAPFYGADIDWLDYGVDLENVELRVEGHRVRGRYLPHRLDSFEPCILFDFEGPVIEACLREHDTVAFAISVGSYCQEFSLPTAAAPAHDLAMSLIIRDGNRWLGYFLDYYLACLECDHVYLYDHQTRDTAELQQIVRPYVDEGKVTYIPWHYRWRNASDHKQIGQIPQQAHSLNKYGKCRWIGFFDHDEYLRIPGGTLKQFLAGIDPDQVDGVSFAPRWFMYKDATTHAESGGRLRIALRTLAQTLKDLSSPLWGEAAGGTSLHQPKLVDETRRLFDEIGNPLLNFFDAKPDARGRKTQKLVVSPRNVRFLRIHWLEDGKRELAVEDTEAFFHHYYLKPMRFAKGLTEPDTVRDDYMLGFAERLINAARRRRGDGEAGNRSVESRPTRKRPKTAEEWIAHVLGAFDIAEAEASGLSAEALAVRGYCGRRNRHFLNALCAFDGCRYFEIGSHAGASMSAAMYGNRISAVAIDNWSQFGGPRGEFLEAMAAFRGANELRLIERNCFEVDPATLGPFDIFYYDGDHRAESHTKALRRFYRCLGDRAIVIVDDWNWAQVREGTNAALAALDMPIIFEKAIILPESDVVDMPKHRGRETWWNGIYVMVIDRQAAPLSASTRPRE